MLLKAATQHLLSIMAIAFENKNLELTTVLNKGLKCPTFPQLTESHWVLKK